VWGLSDAELRQAFEANVAADRALAAERLELIAELTARNVPAIQGFTGVVAWLRQRMLISPGAASHMAKLAKQLPDLPEVAKALSDGALSADQAWEIADAVGPLAGQAKTEAQRFLVREGAALEPLQLRALAAGLHHYLDPEGADEAGRKALAAAEKRAQQSRGFTLTPDGTGRVRLSGHTDAEGAAIIQSALDPLCNPARRTLQAIATGAAPELAGAANAMAGSAGTAGADAAGVDEPLPLPLQDNRTAAQRRHDALIEVFQRTLAAGELPENGGEKTQLVVTVSYDPLSRAVSAATLDTGARLSPEAVRRMACDCGVIPAILDANGVPLDLGRERRLISGALRRALVLRDKGCAFPGCDRPPRWCQGHHVITWLDGGPTRLENSVLVCGYHHRLLHHSDWAVLIASDGLPEFIPPAHLDPSQAPRRNTFHRRT
jgi:hypothetical protein